MYRLPSTSQTLRARHAWPLCASIRHTRDNDIAVACPARVPPHSRELGDARLRQPSRVSVLDPRRSKQSGLTGDTDLTSEGENVALRRVPLTLEDREDISAAWRKDWKTR